MFTLEDVEAAVEATGLTPHSGNYVRRFNKEICFCPASILVVAKHGEKAVGTLRRANREGRVVEHVVRRLAHFDLEQEELESFTGGVDGSPKHRMEDYFDGEFGLECKKAYAVGKAVRKRYSLK